MVGQLLLEDEYVINVKVRRPIDGSCPPPPTFTVACHDAKPGGDVTFDYHGTSLDKKLALPSSDYIGSFTVGPDCVEKREGIDKMDQATKPIGWNNIEPDSASDNDYWEPKKHTSITMKPGGRRIYDGVPLGEKEAPDCGSQTNLPQVKVYGEDSNLLATNVYKPPTEDEKPCQKGLLYVERIADHCKSTSGALYVPPVQHEKLKESKSDPPVMRGNSRRSESERLRAKMNKNPYSSIIQKGSAIQVRNKLMDIGENDIDINDGRPNSTFPALLSLPHNVKQPHSDSVAPNRSLKFPVPQACVSHPCPRLRQLQNSVQLSQSFTLFPTTPDIKPPRQSFNIPPSRSNSSSSVPSRLTDCRPRFSSVFPGSSFRSTNTDQKDTKYCGYTPDEETDITDEEYIGKSAFFQAPASLRSRSSSLKQNPSSIILQDCDQSRSERCNLELYHRLSPPKDMTSILNEPSYSNKFNTDSSSHNYYSDGEFSTAYATSSDNSPDRDTSPGFHKPLYYPDNQRVSKSSSSAPWYSSNAGQHIGISPSNAWKRKNDHQKRAQSFNLSSRSMTNLCPPLRQPKSHIRFVRQEDDSLDETESEVDKPGALRGRTCVRAGSYRSATSVDSTSHRPVWVRNSSSPRSNYSSAPRQCLPSHPRLLSSPYLGSSSPQTARSTRHLTGISRQTPTPTFFPEHMYRQRPAPSRVIQGQHIIFLTVTFFCFYEWPLFLLTT